MLHGPHKRRELIKCSSNASSDEEDVESEIPHLIVKNRAEATRVLFVLWVAVLCIMAAVSFMGYSIYTDNSQGRTGSNAYGANSASNASSVKPRQRERGNTFAENCPDLWDLLDLWANKPGFYSEAYFARIGYPHVFDKHQASETDVPPDATRITAYIAGADGLSQSERELLINSQHIWTGYNSTEKEIITAMNEGLKMSNTEAIDLAKKIANEVGSGSKSVCVNVLYYALTIGAIDGLSDDEKETFVRMAQSMGIEQNKIDEIIETYLLEVKFGEKLSALLGTAGNS